MPAALACLALAAVWWLLLRPTALGGPASYIVVSGISMEPTLYTGDLAVLHRQQAYRPGDVIGFRVKGGQVIHRIVGGSAEEGYLTQGDNKPEVDPWRPKPEDISGAMWFSIPRAGRVLAFLQQPRNAGLFTALVAVAITEGAAQRRPHRRWWLMGTGQDAAPGRSTGADGTTDGGWMAFEGSSVVAARRKRAIRSSAGLTAARRSLPVLAVLALAFAGIWAYSLRQPLTKTDNVVLLRYEHTGAFTYTVHTTPSSLYPSGIVRPMGAGEALVVPTRLVQSVDLEFAYELQAGSDLQAAGDIGAELEIASGEVWSKTSELVAPQPFTGTTASTRVSVRIPDIISLIESIESETGTSGGTYQVRIIPKVRIQGAAGERQFESEFAPPFAMQLTGTNLTLDAELERSELQTQTEAVTLENELDALGYSWPVTELRRITLLGAGVTGALAALLAAVVYGGVGLSEAGRARVRYHSMLVEVSAAEFAGAHRIQMASIADLARVAERDGQVICELADQDRDLYFVHYGPVVYTYEVPQHGKGG